MISILLSILIALPAGVRQIPDGLNNYRAEQLNPSVYAQLPVTTVVRLNGNGKDGNHISIEEERRICEENGIQFHYFNIEGGGVDEKVREILLKGDCLIHCRHGFDRTGAMVGYHLKYLGWNKEEIIKHNKWERYIEKKGEKYKKYFNRIF